MSMLSLPPIRFPPPPPQISLDTNEHGDMSIINAPLEPQPLPIPSTRWYFDKKQLISTPSRKQGIDADKELTFRQQSANFIQDMGQRLQVNQLCINTAIVYMHRFFMYHSFLQFQKNAISTASIFLAAKVEEQPRKLEYVIKISHYCLFHDTQPAMDVKSDEYAAQATEVVSNENILLQTLGFDVSVDHPHTHVVKCCQLVRANKDLAQTSYFMATNSLHLTTMCLQYPPSVVACVCIHLACKWSNWEVREIPRSKEEREWYFYVDGSVTPQQLESLTAEFLTIFNKSPSRLKKRILSLSNATSGGSGGSGGSLTNFPTHFTVERNSFGAQTIKSRSRSPSPPISTSIPTKPIPRPASMSANQNLPQPLMPPMKPIPLSGMTSHYYGNKLIPPPGHPLSKHPLPVLHPSLQGQPNTLGSVGLSRDGHKHLVMRPQFSTCIPSTQSHPQGNRHMHGVHRIPSSQSQPSYPVAYTQMQHGHIPSHHKPPIGSHSQSIHQRLPQYPPAPRLHPFIKLEGKPTATHTSTHVSQSMANHAAQKNESIQHLSTMKTQQSMSQPVLVSVADSGTHNTPMPHVHRGFTRPPTGLRKVANTETTQELNNLKSIPSTQGTHPEYLKRRVVEVTDGRPTPKKPHHFDSQISNLSTILKVPEIKTSIADIPKYVAIKTEPIDSTDTWLKEEKRVDVKLLIPKVEPFDSSTPTMSLSILSPLNGSEVGLSKSAKSHSASRHGETGFHQNHVPKKIKSPTLPAPTIPITPTPTAPLTGTHNSHESPTTSSLKKKKKDRKHKKDKEKTKKDKKHKSDKHRDKQKHQSSKKKKGTSSKTKIAQNALKIKIVASKEKIKIVASKEGMDSNSNSNSSRTSTSSKNQPSNTVVYYY